MLLIDIYLCTTAEEAIDDLLCINSIQVSIATKSPTLLYELASCSLNTCDLPDMHTQLYN